MMRPLWPLPLLSFAVVPLLSSRCQSPTTEARARDGEEKESRTKRRRAPARFASKPERFTFPCSAISREDMGKWSYPRETFLDPFLAVVSDEIEQVIGSSAPLPRLRQ